MLNIWKKYMIKFLNRKDGGLILKTIKKEKIIEIFTYIMIFCVFMGSNFLKFSIFGINFNIARLLTISILIFIILDILKSLIKKQKIIELKDKYLKYCIIFFIIWSIYSALSIYKALDIQMYFILNFFICCGTACILFFSKYINFENKKNIIFNLISIPVFINCLYYLYLFFIKNENIGGLYHNSNDLGTVLLLSIPIVIYLFFNTKNNYYKIVYALILITYIVSFANILSRGAILGAFLAIFMLGIIELVKRKDILLKGKRNKCISLILSVIFIYILYSFIKKYIGLISLTPVENALKSNDVRVNLIYNGLYFLSQGFNWLTGIGSGNTIYYLKNYSIYSIDDIYNFHNFWLDIIVEYGLLIFIGFLITYFITCIKLYKKMKYKNDKISQIFFFFFVSFSIACISSSSLLTREWLWIVFAMTISFFNLPEENINLKKRKELKEMSIDNSKKNIIFVTIIPLWSMNGGKGGKALYCTIEAYVNAGYNVFFVTNQQNDYTKIKKMKKDNIYYIDQKWYKNSSSFYGKLKTLKYYNEFENKSYKKIKAIIKRIGNQNTILYAYEVAAVKSSKKISKKYNIPLVTRFQGTIMANIPPTLYYKLRKYPHIQALSTKSDLIIMTNDGTQGDQVLDNYNNDSKRLFIRNGVNILDEEVKNINKQEVRKKLNIPEDVTILLTVSRLEGWKKVDRSILAFNELHNKEKYRLIIVGDGAEKENLEKLTQKLNLDNYIIFMGAIKNEEVKQYMQLADIFLSFYNLSNVGNPLLEALCLGKPIITYNVGDTNKIINGKNGIILDDVTPKNIAKNIEKINKTENLQKFSKNAYNYSKQNLYSWKHRMELELKEVDKLFD